MKKSIGSGVINSDVDTDKIKDQLEQKLNSFTEKVSQPLPDLSAGPDGNEGYDQFDKLTRDQKVQEWEALHNDCRNMPARLLHQMVEEVEDFIDRLERVAYEV